MKLLDVLDFDHFNGPLREAMERRKKETAKRLVGSLVNAFDTAGGLVQGSVREIRNLQRQLRISREKKDKIVRVLKYFEATNNPLPIYAIAGKYADGEQFCRLVGVDVPERTDPIWSVPIDWQPKSEES